MNSLFIARIGSFVLAFVPAALAAASPPEVQDIVFDGPSKFGCSLSLSGDTLLVGASHDPAAGVAVGSAFILRRTDGTWAQESKLIPPDPSLHDHFGWSVSLDGNVAVVGAAHDDDKAYNCGAAYVYRRMNPADSANPAWTLEAKLLPYDGKASDEFGTAVAVSGDTIVVGAHWDDDMGLNAGSAWVYRRVGDVWTLEAKILVPDGGSAEQFGISVGASGDVVVVGAFGDDTFGTDAGAAYVFRRQPNGTWPIEKKLFASDATFSDHFGRVVAVSGDDVIIGAPEAGATVFNPGAAYIFHHAGADWSQQAKLMASDSEDGEEFGQSVALRDGAALVGVGSDDKGNIVAGAAYMFTRAGTAWSEQTKMEASDGLQAKQFGAALTFGEGLVIVGAPGEGAAYVFDSGIVTEPPLPGDLNGDGCVNGSDLSPLLAFFGLAVPSMDLDGDGLVGGGDLAIILSNWGC